MRHILLAIAFVMLGATAARADSVTAYVLTQFYPTEHYPETVFTFFDVQGASADPFPFVVGGQPFALVSIVYPIPTIYALYGASNIAAFTGFPLPSHYTFMPPSFGFVQLTDVDGVISGLPQEDTLLGQSIILASGPPFSGYPEAVAQLNWLDTHLPGGTAAAPEPSTLMLVGSSLLIIGPLLLWKRMRSAVRV